MTKTPWFAVMVEGEEFPDLIGPFRSEEAAEAVAERWNREHEVAVEGEASILPLQRYAEVK